MPSTTLTLGSLFDLIAPLAIYHGADVCFKARASRAITSLRSAVTQGDPLALEYVGQTTDFEWDLLNSSDLPNDRDVREVYDALLLALVAEEVDDWEPAYDRSGCRCFLVDGKQLDAFCGDSPNHFAWYETAALVRSRILDHVSAMA